MDFFEKNKWATIFGLFLMAMLFGGLFTPQLKEFVGFTVVPPTPTQPGLVEPGDILDRTLTVTPTMDALGEYDESDGFVTILKKTITVWKWGEPTPRKEQSIELLSVSTTTPETMSISYTIPATEPKGTFFVAMIISKSNWQLTDRVAKTWSNLDYETLGTTTETYLLGDVPGPTTEQVNALIQQIIQLVLQRICADYPSWCTK